MMGRCFTLLSILILSTQSLIAQPSSVSGKVTLDGKNLEGVSILLLELKRGAITDTNGLYIIKNVKPGIYTLKATAVGYDEFTKKITLNDGSAILLNIRLNAYAANLDEVIVTGVEGRSKIKNTPLAVAVTTKKEMQYNINANVIDALAKTIPGISTVTTGPNISKPFIRGLGYNRVLTMYDGVRQEGQQWGDEHGVEMDQYGIGRAEVVKGPASLIYGSDAVAGAVNLLPDFPTDITGKLHADALFEYQSNNGLLGTSIGLSQKKGSLMWLARGSFKTAADYQNKIDGRVYGTGFREINFSGMMGIDRNAFKSYVQFNLYDNLQEIPDGSRDSLTRLFTRQVKETFDDDIKNRPIVPLNELTSYHIIPLHQHIQHYRLYNKSSFKLGGGELNSLVGFQQSIRREFNHPTDVNQAGLFVVLNTINYEIKYGLPEWNGLKLTTGVNGIYQHNSSKDATDFPIPDYNLFDAGAYIVARKEAGKFSFSAGIRYDHRHISWNNFYTDNNPSNGFQQHVTGADTSGSNLRFASYHHAFTGISGSAGFTYTFSRSLYMKMNIARGYRSPNITEIGSNGLDPGAHIYYIGSKNFTPEFSLQQDMGLFYNSQDAEASLEIFNNYISNYIFLQKVTDNNGRPLEIVPGNSTYQYRQGNANLYGLEASATVHPQSFKWLYFKNSIAILNGANKDDDLLKEFGDKAKWMPMIPPLHTLSTLRFILPVESASLKNLYLQAEVEHYNAQNKFYAVDNTETYTPGYNLVNIGCGVTVKTKPNKELCMIYFNANNIFNTAYQSHLNRLKYFEYYQSSPNGHSGIYNMGRNISMKIVMKL